MVTIDIDPILISLGPFLMSWYSMFMVVAMTLGVWLPVKLAVKVGLLVDRLRPWLSGEISWGNTRCGNIYRK